MRKAIEGFILLMLNQTFFRKPLETSEQPFSAQQLKNYVTSIKDDKQLNQVPVTLLMLPSGTRSGTASSAVQRQMDLISLRS